MKVLCFAGEEDDDDDDVQLEAVLVPGSRLSKVDTAMKAARASMLGDEEARSRWTQYRNLKVETDEALRPEKMQEARRETERISEERRRNIFSGRDGPGGGD